MAELADALASGASVGNDVQVQVLFRALHSVGNDVQVLPFNDYPLKGPLKVQPTKGEVLFRALQTQPH